MNANEYQMLTETLDRTRRIETRLTKFLESQGFDTQVRRPEWAGGILYVPSPAVSLKDMLACIPEFWPNPVMVVHKGAVILTVQVPTVAPAL